MTLKMAIIGFGKSANRYHLPYLSQRKNIQVKYIYNRRRHPERETAYQNMGIKFTTDLDEVLKDDEIQLITICTPADTHFDFAKQVLKSGKNVLVEKPFCKTVAETKQLLGLAKERDLIAMPYQNRRFDSDYLTLKKVLDRGYVGEPLEIESHMDKYRPDDQVHIGYKINGTFYGLGIHMLDQMLALFGKPESMAYDIRTIQNEASTLDDYYQMDLHYGKLKVTVKTNPLVAEPYPRFILHGTTGSYLKYDIDQQENDLKQGIMPDAPDFGEDTPDKFGHVKYHNKNGDWIEKQIPTVQGDYGRIYDTLYDSIMNGKPKLVSDEETLMDIEILEQGIKQPSPSVVKF